MASTKNKTSGCPIANALEEIEKANIALDKMLAKDTASCAKKFEAVKKKMKKLAEAKAKASIRKKAVSEKMKAKPTPAVKLQLEKVNVALQKTNETLSEVKIDYEGLKHVNMKCASLTKRRQAEAKLIAKFRAEQDRNEIKKTKMKAKPKASKKK